MTLTLYRQFEVRRYVGKYAIGAVNP